MIYYKPLGFKIILIMQSENFNIIRFIINSISK